MLGAYHTVSMRLPACCGLFFAGSASASTVLRPIARASRQSRPAHQAHAQMGSGAKKPDGTRTRRTPETCSTTPASQSQALSGTVQEHRAQTCLPRSKTIQRSARIPLGLPCQQSPYREELHRCDLRVADARENTIRTGPLRCPRPPASCDGCFPLTEASHLAGRSLSACLWHRCPSLCPISSRVVRKTCAGSHFALPKTCPGGYIAHLLFVEHKF
jgi:hypothetical protein